MFRLPARQLSRRVSRACARRKTAVAAANDSYINGVGEIGRGNDGRRIDSRRPEIFLLHGQGMARKDSSIEERLKNNETSKIGIGEKVALPPLPHHRTCGSAYGGSAD